MTINVLKDVKHAYLMIKCRKKRSNGTSLSHLGGGH